MSISFCRTRKSKSNFILCRQEVYVQRSQRSNPGNRNEQDRYIHRIQINIDTRLSMCSLECQVFKMIPMADMTLRFLTTEQRYSSTVSLHELIYQQAPSKNKPMKIRSSLTNIPNNTFETPNLDIKIQMPRSGKRSGREARPPRIFDRQNIYRFLRQSHIHF